MSRKHDLPYGSVPESMPPKGPPQYNPANCSCKCQSCTCSSAGDDGSGEGNNDAAELLFDGFDGFSGCLSQQAVQLQLEGDDLGEYAGGANSIMQGRVSRTISELLLAQDAGPMEGLSFTKAGATNLELTFTEAAQRFGDSPRYVDGITAHLGEPGTPDSLAAQHGSSSLRSRISSVSLVLEPSEDIVELLRAIGAWRIPTPQRPAYYFTSAPLILCP